MRFSVLENVDLNTERDVKGSILNCLYETWIKSRNASILNDHAQLVGKCFRRNFHLDSNVKFPDVMEMFGRVEDENELIPELLD